MNKFVVILVSVFLLTGCAGSRAWHSMRISSTEAESKVNNEKIMSLNIGQTRAEVLRIMGNPSKREVYQLENQKIVEFLFYRTSGWSSTDSGDRDYQFTPFAFENEKLVGWGRNYYDNVVRHAVDINLK
ncbi:DUF3192 domain-containing protein [bacterium]|nr:DUF3192 domain-containing protein [bacterium]